MRGSSPLALIAALGIVAAAVVGGAVLLIASRPAPVTIIINPPPPTPEASPTATPAPITVYVTGAVNQPETVVSLPAGSRIKDAVDAAGGASADADLEQIDLAAPLHDGDHVHVYARGESVQVPLSSTASDSLVHVNRATLEELETLPGIGAVLGQRIIDYRTAHGAFTSLDDLLAVSGIGDHVIQEIQGLVAFD